MKIIIAGAGEVGTHLAKMLCNENHDIVLLDENEDKLNLISSNLDLLTINGSSTTINDLKECGINSCELFIAVTPYEEQNMFSCILAKELGAQRTIARIDHQEYLYPQNMERFIKLGVDELIYPEHLAAKEIVTSLKQTTTRQIHEFSGGKLVLFGIKIRDNAQIVNKSLEITASENDFSFRAVAITRESKTIIPQGKDLILPEDIVYFVAQPSDVQKILDISGKKPFDVKNVMILGGSRIAQKTAKRLGDNFNIKILEIDREKSLKLADRLEDVLVINGDGRDLDLLREEGIDKMDAFIALTGNSETNILSCQIAKKFGVRRTVAEVENIDYINLAENTGIGRVINKKLIAASKIYEYTINAEVAHVKCLSTSEAEVMEFIAKPGSKITTKPIRELSFPDDATIGGIIRSDRGYIANGNMEIEEGDKVVIFALPSALRKLSKFFN